MINAIHRIAPAFAVVLLAQLWPCGAGRAQAPALPDAAHMGQAIYHAKGCYQCHGLVGQGSVLTGPALSPLRLQPEAFRAYVRHPAGVMPPYSQAILSDGDLDAVAAFVRSLPPARPIADIPLLAGFAGSAGKGPTPRPAAVAASPPSAAPATAVPGRALYEANCAACHGEARKGGDGPTLRQEAKKRTLEQTVRLIIDPPPGMPKLSPEPLSVAEVNMIADYIRTR